MTRRGLPPVDVRGVTVPGFLYGTAWKEQATEELVVRAVTAGFRGIDTANQRKHYHEAGVGAALARLFAGGTVARSDVFLQTKFTFRGGQDHRLPYDPQASIADQVAQSFASSLEHLGVDTLDSLVLHGPSQGRGLGRADHDAWRAMETIAGEKRVRLLGVSNVSAEQLAALLELARVAPAFVQNRCYARFGWDHAVRALCREHGIVYQGFSLLTANGRELADPRARAITTRHDRTLPQVVFRFAHQLGMLPLTGTTDPEHMREDLAIGDFELSADEVATLTRLAARG